MVTENSFLCNQRYLFNRPKCSSGRRASGFVLVAKGRVIRPPQSWFDPDLIVHSESELLLTPEVISVVWMDMWPRRNCRFAYLRQVDWRPRGSPFAEASAPGGSRNGSTEMLS